MTHFFECSFETVRTTKTRYIVCNDLLNHEVIAAWRAMPSVLVIDETVAQLHGELVGRLVADIAPLGVKKIRAGESCKSLECLEDLFEFFSEAGLAKHGLVIAIGGGTVCDVSNAAAQMFRRGIGLALIPSTLLSQIDAAVGGKNGLNFRNTKNLVGHFYHPDWVVCDVRFLRTLDRLQVVGGFAEAIKVLCVSDATALQRHFRSRPLGLEHFTPADLMDLVSVCIARKLSLLDSDPFERSSRRLLNYGHAFAHTFEEQSAFLLTHGEAVLMGMTIENFISVELGMGRDFVDEVQSIINCYLTDNCLRYWFGSDQVLPLLEKLRAARRNQLNLVCLTEPGKAEILDSVGNATIMAAWNKSGRILERARQLKISA